MRKRVLSFHNRQQPFRRLPGMKSVRQMLHMYADESTEIRDFSMAETERQNFSVQAIQKIKNFSEHMLRVITHI